MITKENKSAPSKLFSQLVIYFLLISISPIVNAFQLSPVSVALEPAGIKAQQVYLLTNTGNKPAAIEFSITTRQQRPNGSEIRHPAQHLFNLYPTQVVIPSGGTQKVRLRWLGKKPVSREQSYRFIAKQLPINLSKEPGLHLNMVMTMETAVYIRPVGQTRLKSRSSNTRKKTTEQRANQTSTRAAMLKVIGVKIVNTPQGKRLALTVKNPARAHFILSNIQVQLIAGQQKISLRGAQLGNMQKQNLLAGSIRNFMLPIPAQFKQQKNWQARVQRIN